MTRRMKIIVAPEKWNTLKENLEKARRQLQDLRAVFTVEVKSNEGYVPMAQDAAQRASRSRAQVILRMVEDANVTIQTCLSQEQHGGVW